MENLEIRKTLYLTKMSDLAFNGLQKMWGTAGKINNKLYTI